MKKIHIRDIQSDEFEALGEIMIDAYSSLEGFLSSQEQPGYYEMLRHIGSFTEKPATRVLVALSDHAEILGGVVSFVTWLNTALVEAPPGRKMLRASSCWLCEKI